MSRRAPPREYYSEEEDINIEIERPRDPYPHPRRRRRHNGELEEEEEIEFRRRRSIPPVHEMSRLDIRERPPRDFMWESFETPPARAAMVMRGPREDVDVDVDVDVDRIPRERRRHQPREIDEEEEEMIRMSQRERDRGGDRRRRSERDLVDEEEVVLRRRERAPPRGYESDRDFGRGRFADDGIQRQSGNRKSVRRRDIDEYLVDESGREWVRPRKAREKAGVERRRSVDELVVDDGERDRPRRWRSGGEREVDEALIIDERDRDRPRRRRSGGEREVEEELIVDEREPTRPRDRRLHGKPRHKEEIIMKWKDRPSPGEIDEDEILFRETHRQRGRSSPDPRLSREPPHSYSPDRDGEVPDEEIRIRSRVRPWHHGANEEDEEIIIRRNERERRHRAEEEEDFAVFRDQRERDRRRAVEDEEEDVIFQHRERNRRRGSQEDDEIRFRKNRQMSSPRERSPSLKSIHAPPIHQDVIMHHRHVDHGYEPPPRAPSPEIPSTRTSFDEVDVDHRSKRSHKSEEDILLKYHEEEESITPTSGPSRDFNNPWEADRISLRSKARPKSLLDDDDEIKSAAARSSRSRAPKALYREIDVDVHDNGAKEKIIVEESSSTSRSRARSQADDLHDTPDEWSVVHAPCKDEAAEMSGALNVVEIAPKGSINEEPDDRVGTQVSKERRDERWTEITKDLVVREAIERLGYEFEETRTFYYIFSYMEPGDIDELVDLSDAIRQARRRRIREMHRERASIPRPASWADRPRPLPPVGAARRMREREWFINTRT